MGWLFPYGASRRSLIAERTQGWERASDSMLTKSVCLAHCYRGGVFSGVLWSVWERTFTKDGRASRSDPTLDSVRLAAIQSRRLGLQGHGRVDASVLLFVSARLLEVGADGAVRRPRTVARRRPCLSRAAERKASGEAIAKNGGDDDDEQPSRFFPKRRRLARCRSSRKAATAASAATRHRGESGRSRPSTHDVVRSMASLRSSRRW